MSKIKISFKTLECFDYTLRFETKNVLGLCWLWTNLAYGQFTNPSFNALYIGGPTDDWKDCVGSATTSNNQPGWNGVDIRPQEGCCYLGMVVRGGTCQECNESVSQKLISPLKPDACYAFSIYLSHDSKGYDGYNDKAILRIWGSNNPLNNCGKTELLWTSPVPNSDVWTKYTVQFTPSKTYTHIVLEAYYRDKSAESRAGHILLDNLSDFRAYPIWKGFNLGKDTTLCRDDNLLLTVIPPDNLGYVPTRWSDG